MLNLTQLLTSGQARPEIACPVIVWNLTDACNLGCKFCYYDAKSETLAGSIDFGLAKQLIKKIKELNVKFVLLSGGEPFLYPDILGLINELTSGSIQVGISTNGTLIDKRSAADLKNAGAAYVGISLDGPEKLHNVLRNSSTAFSRAVAGLKNIQDAGIKSGIRLTLNSHNYLQLKDFFALAENLKPDRLCFYHLVFAGRASNVDYDLPLQKRKAAVELIIKKADEWIKRGIPIQVLTVDNFSDAVILLKYVRNEYPARYTSIFELLKRQGGCPADKGILSIDHQGTFHPCQFWQSENILPYDWRLRLKGRCGSCEYKALCGGCRVRAYQRYKDFLEEDPSCCLEDSEIGCKHETYLVEYNQRM